MNATIQQRLKRGELVRVMFLGALANPKLIEIAGLAGGLHGVWVDQEHSAVPHQELELLMMACRAAGLDGFARVAPTDYGAVMRPMEAGASGVMVAQVRTLDQVKQAVEWAKYPPRGIRGLFMANFEAAYGTADMAVHIETANRERWVCIQIETAEAVERVEQIAALEGVDWLFVGPSDLACCLGVPGQVLHPKCIAALEKVSSAVKAASKSWGTLSRAPEHATRCRELGCQLFSLMGDLDLVQRGLQVTKKLFAELFAD
jgi:2-dehydro-3-deoxyglucarate aldolase/4-hydroxy-2-oxoheptanedioate aldolase